MISEKEIIKLSRLAKLNIKKKHIKKLQKDITNIIDMLENLQTIDTDNIEPMYSVCNTPLTMHDDEVNMTNTIEDIFSNTRKEISGISVDAKYYLTPKVIEEK